MTYCFYAKSGVDYSKYGFIHEDNQWVIWRGTRRITIKENQNNFMSFNSVTNEILKIFMDMVNDNVVIVSTYKEHKPRKHYINLDDEEYQMILERRKEINDYETK